MLLWLCLSSSLSKTKNISLGKDLKKEDAEHIYTLHKQIRAGGGGGQAPSPGTLGLVWVLVLLPFDLWVLLTRGLKRVVVKASCQPWGSERTFGGDPE